MGKPDTVTKEYIRRPDIFADVFNQFLYHGEQVIRPGDLTELDTTEIAVPYGIDNISVPEQRYRDAAKLLAAMTDGKAAYCILCVENEDKINYAMQEHFDKCSSEEWPIRFYAACKAGYRNRTFAQEVRE